MLEIPGVVQIVGSGSSPEPILDGEIDALKKLMDSTLAYDAHPYLWEGMAVQVIRGPLEGARGVLIRKEKQYRLVISVHLIKQAAAVEVDAADVVPIYNCCFVCMSGALPKMLFPFSQINRTSWPDPRNARVVDIVHELGEYDVTVDVGDPRVSAEEAYMNMALLRSRSLQADVCGGIILAIAHREFRVMGQQAVCASGKAQHMLFDLKNVLPRSLRSPLVMSEQYPITLDCEYHFWERLSVGVVLAAITTTPNDKSILH